MKILHIVAGLWKNTGGPSEVIPNLCAELVRNGHEVTILTVDGDNAISLKQAEASGVKVIYFKPGLLKPIRFASGMYAYLSKHASSYDIIHNHGHWLYSNWLSAIASKKYSVPLVTTPHGTLVPGMLSYSKFKKAISWLLFDRFIIKQASLIHCLSETEAELTVKKIGIVNKSKIQIIPNAASNDFFRIPSLNSEKCNNLNFLYMSRVSKIKGINDLYECWIKSDLPNATLTIVGPWDQSLLALKDKFNNLENVKVIGPSYGEERLQFMESATAFILPSYGEGLPTALLEASAAGRFVIYTKECNFNRLELAGLGLCYEAGVKQLNSTLDAFTNLSTEDILEGSNNIRAFAKQFYSWGSVCEEWIKEYERVLLK